MPQFEIVKAFGQIKLLADPRRLAILKRLMGSPATLTQLGEMFGEHPAWIRHHLKQLELAGLVEMVEKRVTSGVVEKFYRAHAAGMLVQELILPENLDRPAVVFSGSNDPAIALLAEQLADQMDMLVLSVGSLDGLITLRQGLCNFSGCHLLDINGEYNLPFIRHIFPDRAVQIYTLAHREQGLMIAPGNPKGIRSLKDLARLDITFINRNLGSGTRLWLDRQLETLSIAPSAIHGYEHTVMTHTECAEALQHGAADMALGLQASAMQYDLGFIPLFSERYDLVFPAEHNPLQNQIIESIRTKEFRQAVEHLSGYDLSHTGEQILI